MLFFLVRIYRRRQGCWSRWVDQAGRQAKCFVFPVEIFEDLVILRPRKSIRWVILRSRQYVAV